VCRREDATRQGFEVDKENQKTFVGYRKSKPGKVINTGRCGFAQRFAHKNPDQTVNPEAIFADLLPSAAFDPDLLHIIESWPKAPEPIRRAMLALIGCG
jgi:hypothetical protein